MESRVENIWAKKDIVEKSLKTKKEEIIFTKYVLRELYLFCVQNTFTFITSESG